ncbi:DUF2730 family protein [Palleronia caenipelagi]|uniref:DUF2730 family protein n=1 Tax=Palleronia caenipelagi TaxID=2489174 RepID=A0A547PW48_9RHOB|nr:DUF2730 family protein [Palleronia caenipelagi]TRD18380.1 DUF2730 family protein [Palleronia caenipelagi]
MTFDPDMMIKILSLGLSAGAIVYSYIANRRKDMDALFKEGSKRMARHDERISVVEQRLDHMPGKDDTHALQLELARMSGSLGELVVMVKAQGERMVRLENGFNRHEDHLREGGKR